MQLQTIPRVADLHCDLLSYLALAENRSAYHEESRSSLTQLKKGGVFFQVLAIFTITDQQSVAFAEKQFNLFCNLEKIYSQDVVRVHQLQDMQTQVKIQIAAAIENASGLCSETEPLELCFHRFDRYFELASPIVYISLTWNHENRFGGGNYTQVGLKRDGELLLEYISGKGVCIDLSHTSDQLAHDIIDHIDKKNLKITPIASHSNFREIKPELRNLPDAIAKEIVVRGGVIGLNFFRPFVGNNCPEDFVRQVDYARRLGAFDNYCFGADFFYDNGLPISSYSLPFYCTPFENSGCYPHFIDYLNKKFSADDLEKIAHRNLTDFFKRISYTNS